jgi:hypothetical protein
MAEQDDEGTPTRGTIAKNTRAQAIAKITNILDKLSDDSARGTVLKFIVNEYRGLLDGAL